MQNRWLLILAWVIALGGCASSGTLVDPKDNTVSLVYGYFDMSDAPSGFDWVSIKQYGSGPSFYEAPGKKTGLFMHVGIKPGSYQVETFGGLGGIPFLTQRDYKYNFGTRGRNETAIRIQQPSVYFMGAYKYIPHSGGFFGADKFEMKAIKSPSEPEILQKLIAEMESDPELKIYTRQLGLAKKRLADLQR